jgi:hypothetical protein
MVNGDVIDLKRDIDDLKRAVGLERLPRKPRPQRQRDRDPYDHRGTRDMRLQADDANAGVVEHLPS